MAKAMEKKKAMTKTEILNGLAEATATSKKEVEKVLDALTDMIQKNIKKTDDVFTLPGVMKVRNVKKKATKARKGINPKTGQEIEIAAKPARNVVKISPLKALKDVV